MVSTGKRVETGAAGANAKQDDRRNPAIARRTRRHLRIWSDYMNTDALKETIRKELPVLLREDPALRAFLQDLMREQYAGRQETYDKFERLLGELRRDLGLFRARQLPLETARQCEGAIGGVKLRPASSEGIRHGTDSAFEA
jgi:hypothetical protein